MTEQKSGNNPLFQQGHIKQGITVPPTSAGEAAPQDAPAAEQTPDSGTSAPEQ